MPDPQFVHSAFAAIAPQYVATNHILSMGIDVLWRKRVASLISEWAPQTLLDIATGTGDLALTLKEYLPGTHITGTDFCQPMLDIAAKRGLTNLICADALHLPFSDASFDATTVAFGLRNMESYQNALKEMHRVLTPGGHTVILDFSLPEHSLLRVPYRWYLHGILPKIAGWITGHPEAYSYLGESIEQFPSGHAMISLLKDCGFTHASAEPLHGGIATIYLGEK